MADYETKSSSGQSMHYATLSADAVSTKERLKLCCKPTYKMRRVKRKGAILVLTCNFLATFVLWHLIDSRYRRYSQSQKSSETVIGMAMLGVALPIAGWLADAWVGRYRMIYCSVLIMWAATVLETLSKAIENLVGSSYTSVDNVVTHALFGLMGIGMGSFLSTTVQFGIDQLHDASTDEISAYIMWHIWTCCCSFSVTDLASKYLQFNNRHLIYLLGHLALCTNLSLILVMWFCYNNWLIKEPVMHNPFKLIYRVSKYALRNKRPQCRSAFTYCEDGPIGRIDYGKIKYGGPFTTEQVEDVKTFYKLLPIVILAGIFAGEQVAGKHLRDFLENQFVLPSNNSEMKGFTNASISSIILYSASILIVLHEVLLHPILHRCCAWITSMQKHIMGTILLIGMFLALMIFELISRRYYLEENGYNETVLCVFYKDQALATKLNYNWIAIPDTLFVISILLMAVGSLEFIAAQVPYSMKGVLLGVGCQSLVISGTINDISIIVGPFQRKPSTWDTKIISCGFWYALMHILLCVTGSIISALVIKWYKRRKREDVLPNEHFYAENYYSKLLEHPS